MSDHPEAQHATDEAVEATGEQPMGGWSEGNQGPAWSNLADAESAVPGSAEPGTAPEAGSVPEPSTDTPSTDTGSEPESAIEAGRSRRPSSLREGAAPTGALGGSAQPQSPGPQPQTGSPISSPPAADRLPPFSEAASGGRPRQMPNPASLLEKLPVEKLPVEVDKLKSLIRERPEVGVGLAFAGGLVLATILRRLAR